MPFCRYSLGHSGNQKGAAQHGAGQDVVAACALQEGAGAGWHRGGKMPTGTNLWVGWLEAGCVLRLHQVTAVICVPDCGNFLIPSKTSVCANDTAFISLGVMSVTFWGTFWFQLYLFISAAKHTQLCRGTLCFSSLRGSWRSCWEYHILL